MAVFFEPFEGGNALLRMAYEQILLTDRQADNLGIEHVLSPELRRDIPVEARVIFSRRER
jgi:hypothetical protein